MLRTRSVLVYVHVHAPCSSTTSSVCISVLCTLYLCLSVSLLAGTLYLVVCISLAVGVELLVFLVVISYALTLCYVG